MNRLFLILSAAAVLLSACRETNPQEPKDPLAIEVEAPEWDGVKRADITYQLLLYSFADSGTDGWGDFKGVQDHLDYIDALGASAIWLSPVHPCSSYHGYDVTDYAAVNPKFGSEADLKSLIDAAHERGIKVYLDYVLNHTSVDHPWFKSAKESKDSPHRDKYIFSYSPKADIASGLIPMISSEGSGGYDVGQWFATRAKAEPQNVRLTLNWTSTPTLTMEKVATVTNEGNPSSGKFLWAGDSGKCVEFYSNGNNVYTLSLTLQSDWGLLIRTSSSTWDGGTKYGGKAADHQLEWGKPFRLDNTEAWDIFLPEQEQFHSHFWTGAFADLNYGKAEECENSSAFKAVTEAADKWIALGVDGFRLDAVQHIYHRQGGSENPTFLRKFYDHCNASYKAAGHKDDIYMVGEVFNEHNLVAPYYAGLPALFEFSFWYRLDWALSAGTGRYFCKDISGYRTEYEAVRPGAFAATKLTNHDESRAASSFGRNAAKEKLAACVLLTSSGNPYVYQGEELGYWGKKDNGDEYVRTPILWGGSEKLADKALGDKVDRDMLAQGAMSVASQAADPESVLNVYRKFGVLRNSCDALAHGRMQRHPIYNDSNADAPAVACWYMVSGAEKILVLHNFSGASVTVSLPDDNISHALAVNGGVRFAEPGSSSLELGPYSSILFLQ